MWTQIIRNAINDIVNGLNRNFSRLHWLAAYCTVGFRSPAEAGKTCLVQHAQSKM